jgi:hypothetical protein
MAVVEYLNREPGRFEQIGNTANWLAKTSQRDSESFTGMK